MRRSRSGGSIMTDRETSLAARIVRARGAAMSPAGHGVKRKTAEGGCGVLGLAANFPAPGHAVRAGVASMRNRGNGMGGGVAMVGLDPAALGVDRETLAQRTLIHMAYIDRSAQAAVESRLQERFVILHRSKVPAREDWTVSGLRHKPPAVWRYFVIPEDAALRAMCLELDLTIAADGAARTAEDELVHQSMHHINREFYADGAHRAFVLSHGRDIAVFKLVGYAEEALDHYLLNTMTARVWVAHQRYPTRGRVMHPAGSHPFAASHLALAHNGDLANYVSVASALLESNTAPLFATDTELAALTMDLYLRAHGYPLEYVLELLAPTSRYDMQFLDAEKASAYAATQRAHIHHSPDGPWFFVVGRADPDTHRGELLGVTDTSMLRPHVFSLFENRCLEDSAALSVGMVASERHAIHAAHRRLAALDPRIKPLPDHTWSARGGSHTDGGAYAFRIGLDNRLVCTNKFGEPVQLDDFCEHAPLAPPLAPTPLAEIMVEAVQDRLWTEAEDAATPLLQAMPTLRWSQLTAVLDALVRVAAQEGAIWRRALDLLTLLLDRPFPCGEKKASSVRVMVEEAVDKVLELASGPAGGGAAPEAWRLDYETRTELDNPRTVEDFGGRAHTQHTLVVDARGFPREGEASLARFVAVATRLGWRRIILHRLRGHRFLGCGLGELGRGVRIDCYGDAGDYAGSGVDGADLRLHGHGQDQLGQIFRSGRLVAHGDVGHAFLYGAKGGEIFVLGSAASRPVINAVGAPRVVINGACLDFLAESFMAGDPLHGGGFVVINGVAPSMPTRSESVDDAVDALTFLPTPYPGGNLFSRSSGGAVYVRDPGGVVKEGQLNGGRLTTLTAADWALLEPMLQENERLLGVRVKALLTHEGRALPPHRIYRKVEPEV